MDLLTSLNKVTRSLAQRDRDPALLIRDMLINAAGLTNSTDLALYSAASVKHGPIYRVKNGDGPNPKCVGPDEKGGLAGFENIAAHVLKSGKIFRESVPKEKGEHDVLAVPLPKDGDGPDGVLVAQRRKGDAFTTSDQSMLRLYTNLMDLVLREDKVLAREQASRERAWEGDVMRWVGEQSFELIHRLGNDLGVLPIALDRLREKMILGASRDELSHGLLEIKDKIRSRLQFLSDLRQKIATPNLQDQEAEWFPLGVLLEEITPKYHLVPNRVDLEVEMPAHGVAIFAVRSFVADVLSVLLNNAVEAMPNGGKITVKVISEKEKVRIKVHDTGPGVPKADRKRIFDFLYSTKGSSGFGLWSAKRKAEACGGTLTLAPAEESCATFVLALPGKSTK